MIKPEIYKALGLTDQDYQKIERILGREPSHTELAMLSVEWSEHCGYPSSKKYLKMFPQTGKYPTLVGEDSGGIIVDDMAIVFKMESHNHPSQVDPKQGAATGVGGIIRDIFTAGARPIASLDSLRFGPLSEPYNKYLLSGVVEGIAFYGNCLGVPTVGGEVYFDESYSGNCLVNAMSIGICPKEKLVRAQARGIGNSIMYVGGSTGRDGIGGASILASAEFGVDESKRPTVQIGDPFTEKCLIEATLEALDTGYITGIKDMGAAGLTCSISEMAAAGESGMEVELQRVPRREEGMEPWEVMMSESQERMLACVKTGYEDQIKALFEKWDLNAVVIGTVTEGHNVLIKDKGQVICDLPTAALVDPPIYDLPFQKPDNLDEMNKLDLKTIPVPKDYDEVLIKLLSSPNIASKHWVYEQYDHMVQLHTSVLPGSDAAVLRIQGMKKALAATSDCNSRYCLLNPFVGAQIAVAEAARNLVCSGADPAAVTDCLNFGNPMKPDRFYYFKNCVEGIIAACKSFGTPVISGNVSFYNENPRGAINPTPTIGMVGVMDSIEQRTTQYFKNEGDVIILLGETKEEIGGSEYLKVVHGQVRGDAPSLSLEAEKNLQTAVLEAIKAGLINSAHDCSEGGLAVALAECCISGSSNELRGANVKAEAAVRRDALLFGESQSRVIISCTKNNAAKVLAICSAHKVPVAQIGEVCGDHLMINDLINLPLNKIQPAWRDGLTKQIKGDKIK